MRRAVFLIDGEHYAKTTKDAMGLLERRFDVQAVGAGLIGEMRKLDEEALALLDIPVVREEGSAGTLKTLIERFKPDLIVDLSDAAEVDVQMRLRFAAIAFDAGVEYRGADFLFSPVRRLPVEKAALTIVGLAKRVGKTAASVRTAKAAVKAGRSPIIFTMGRGGPDKPLVLNPPKAMSIKELIWLSEKGVHSAGDQFESFIFGGVAVVGCRRAGGGIGASVFYTNLGEGLAEAEKLNGDLYIFEGSGTTEPPVKSASVLLVPSFFPVSRLEEPFNEVRVRRANIVVLTVAEPPFASEEQIVRLSDRIKAMNSDVKVCATVFRPHPTESIEGAKVVVATTAKEEAFSTIWRHLEDTYGCSVVAMTGALADRAALRDELNLLFKESDSDLLLVELKAASIEVGARLAMAAGKKVVLMENRLEDIDGWEVSYEDAVVELLDRQLR